MLSKEVSNLKINVRGMVLKLKNIIEDEEGVRMVEKFSE